VRRPSWILLAAGTVKRLEPVIMKLSRLDPEDGCPWELVAGDGGYVAIIEDEPGSQGGGDNLAKALSKTTKKRAYVVTIDDDEAPSRVEAFDGGKLKGEVKAGPRDVLATLGFSFDWMDGGKKVALRLEAPMVRAKPREPMIWNWSVSQWQQMMRKGGNWYMLLEGVGPKTIDQILAICEHEDAEVRFLAATMLRHVGYYGLNMEQRLPQGLAALEKLGNDRSKKVSALAIKTRDDIIERGEYEAVRARLPWILNYNEQYLPKALALLDEDRPTVHRYIYGWLSQGIWNKKSLPKPAVTKLKQLAKTTPRAKELLDELADA
jgi:hypothetical protein